MSRPGNSLQPEQLALPPATDPRLFHEPDLATPGLQAGLSNQGLEALWRGLAGPERRLGEGPETAGPAGAETARSGRGPAAGEVDLRGRTVGRMKPEEFALAFGERGRQAQSLAGRLPGLTGAQMEKLLQRPQDAEALGRLLQERPDLTADEVLNCSADGRVRVNGTVRDGHSREVLGARHDVRPGELGGMKASFTQSLQDPGLAREAYRSSLDLLKVRGDVGPAGLSSFMGAVAGDPATRGPVDALERFQGGLQQLRNQPGTSLDSLTRDLQRREPTAS